ncbi:YifB family Mg chelatase-like AAA ATPase [Leucobacter sp. USHLN153]|uniref:YifB family Mg chelatase-like AAA ATPase n=1 Tax=Leucobacter sp. USHLN153 TaxID=3081268 RepID=UPI00301ABCBE
MSGVVCRAASVALTGLEGTTVMVESAVSQQLPGIAIIGLPDTALAEAKLRVRTATAQVGLPLSDRFHTINLSPASLPKHGSGFDLAIALAALAASRHLPPEGLESVAHLGELALDGGLRRPAGLLSLASAARALGFRRVMVPEECGEEAALVPGIEVVAVRDLGSAVAWYRGELDRGRIVLPGAEPSGTGANRDGFHGTQGAAVPDMRDVIGQPEAVEAMVIAAAGRHHLSLLGPPGAGKTLLATRLPALLPPLTDDAALEASSIASLGGSTVTELVRHPPFESPHHTASAVSIIGGGQGSEVRPGAITRACHGVLFLDEAPEFPRMVLDALRQPLETGRIEIHRSRLRTVLPARVQLVLAANPCPCGNAGSPDTALRCRCTPRARTSYQQRISGPLSDRIDVRLTLHRVSRVLLEEPEEHRPSSEELQARVIAARASAAERWRGARWSVNADVPGTSLRSGPFQLPRGDTAVLDQALARGALTLRGYDRALRVAWTIADLAGRDRPRRAEVAQALVLRGGDFG